MARRYQRTMCSMRPVRPKAPSINDVPIDELSDVYRFLHERSPSLEGRALDTAVLEYYDMPTSLKGQLAHLTKARHDALLCIIEDLTGASGIHPQATTHLGTPTKGTRRWRRRHKRPPAAQEKDDTNWSLEEETAILAIGTDEPVDIPQVPGHLVMHHQGLTAYGFLIADGFILGKGSMLLPTSGIDKYRDEVQFYNRFGWVRYIGADSRLTSDIEFPTSNAAACFVAGKSVNGMKLWRLHGRTSLKELLP